MTNINDVAWCEWALGSIHTCDLLGMNHIVWTFQSIQSQKNGTQNGTFQSRQKLIKYQVSMHLLGILFSEYLTQ